MAGLTNELPLFHGSHEERRVLRCLRFLRWCCVHGCPVARIFRAIDSGCVLLLWTSQVLLDCVSVRVVGSDGLSCGRGSVAI